MTDELGQSFRELLEGLPASAEVNLDLLEEMRQAGEIIVGLETLCLQVGERNVPVTATWRRQLVSLCEGANIERRFIELVDV